MIEGTDFKKVVARRRGLAGICKAVLVSTSLVLAGTALGWAAPQVGTASAVRGDVLVLTEGARRKAEVRSSIQLNDEVQTKDDSALQILLLDQTIFTIGQNCSIIIDEFVYDPNGPSGSLGTQVLTGAFRYMSGQIAKANPQAVNIETPGATIGIRGTMAEGVVGPDAVALAQLGGVDTSSASPEEASITLLRGPGMGANTLDESGGITVTSGGETRTISEPGYFIFVPGPGQPPLGPFPVTDDLLEYLDFFLRSAPSGPTENPISVAGGDIESGQHLFESDLDGDGFNPGDGDGIEDRFPIMEEDDEEEEEEEGNGGEDADREAEPEMDDEDEIAS